MPTWARLGARAVSAVPGFSILVGDWVQKLTFHVSSASAHRFHSDSKCSRSFYNQGNLVRVEASGHRMSWWLLTSGGFSPPGPHSFSFASPTAAVLVWQWCRRFSEGRKAQYLLWWFCWISWEPRAWLPQRREGCRVVLPPLEGEVLTLGQVSTSQGHSGGHSGP